MEKSTELVVKLPVINGLCDSILVLDSHVWYEIEQNYFNEEYIYLYEDSENGNEYELNLGHLVRDAEILNVEPEPFKILHSHDMMNILCLEATQSWGIYYTLLMDVKPFLDKNGVQELTLECLKMDMVGLTGILRGHRLIIINYIDDEENVKLTVNGQSYDIKVSAKQEMLKIFDSLDIAPEVLPKGKTLGDVMDKTSDDILNKIDDMFIKGDN